MKTATLISKKTRTTISAEQSAIFILLLIGIVLRLRQYLAGRSLWLDEAMLALNIVNRGFAGLFQPLGYDQGAPIGFLLVEKIANILFGNHEFVLRFFPFVAGVTALVPFYFLLRRSTSGIGLLTGLALFVVSPELIYYSSEVKQYIVDVNISIGLLLLAFPLFLEDYQKENYLFLGTSGVLALWFSHPALFVLAGIGVSMLIHSLQKRGNSQLGSILMMGAAWFASLVLLYFSSLRNLSKNTFLLDYWQENFMPMPPWSNLGWFTLLIKGMVQNQVGVFASTWLVFALLFLGVIALFKINNTYSKAVLLTFIFTLIASGLGLYPIGGRLSLFLVPLLIVLISQSLSLLHQITSLQYKLSGIILLLVGVYLVYAPAMESFNRFFEPKYREHIRPAMAVLAENWEEGDVLFVSNGAAPAFRYYAPRFHLDHIAFRSNQNSDYKYPAVFLEQLETLKGSPRVWILMSHVYQKDNFNEKNYVLDYLKTIGNKRREFSFPGTSVYLYLYNLE